ncbi:MAG: PEP-CTERM sorting domain-containing protein [Fimbriimonadaceae bacterium]|nr:PEP-CTERM sorting domain-containing protein [Fimbriimonadaceae bacterium]
MRNILLIAAAVSIAAVSSATTLTLRANADDFLTAYLSTDDSVAGTAFLTKEDSTWQTGPVQQSVTLVDGVTNYLHIRARDSFGAPSMLVGEASIDNNDFWFGNLTQNLLTNTTDWTASLTGFGVNDLSPVDVGANGSGPWGATGGAGIDAAARLIWTTPLGQQPGGDTGYYTAVIHTDAVPEPVSLLGLAAAGFLARRRR